jgi:hypothetical protein
MTVIDETACGGPTEMLLQGDDAALAALELAENLADKMLQPRVVTPQLFSQLA